MANAVIQSITWRDSKGLTCQSRYYVTSASAAASQTAAGAVAAGMAGISNAAKQAQRGAAGTVAGPVVYGTTANFAAITDKVLLTFSAADGSLHRFQVPCPKIAVFEVDTITVDAAQTDMAACITAMLANIQTAAGASLTSYVGGVRISKPLHRRYNILVKVPELDEPAE